MNMQDQTRKAFGYYVSRVHACATAGNLAKSLVGSDFKVGSELNPLLMKRGDDLELPSYVMPPIVDDRLKKQGNDLESPLYVAPDSSAMDYDGDSLPDEKNYRRLAKRSRSYEAGNRTDDYVAPPKAEDISFTDVLINQNQDNLNIDVSGHGSPDVIIARPGVAKELGSTFVNGFGDTVKIVSSDDIGYDFDGDSLPDEKSYRRLAKRARGYEAGSLTNDYVEPPKYDDYVQPPKYDDYVQPPTFDASQFEMSNNEATKSIDDALMGIDEGQFDIGPSKGLQQ